MRLAGFVVANSTLTWLWALSTAIAFLAFVTIAVGIVRGDSFGWWFNVFVVSCTSGAIASLTGALI